MNNSVIIWCLLALTASSAASGGSGYGDILYAPGHASADYYAYPRYAFEYAVRDPITGDNKAQWEKRDGDVVRGAYSLVEPDGNLRTVEYWADDKSGFNAVVKRGPSLHPTAHPVAPIYKAPIPVLSPGPVIAPISVGPVAKYSGLAAAPLISGPLGTGVAISTASLYKATPVVSPAPLAPVIAPIAPPPPAPLLLSYRPEPLPPYVPVPIIKPAPLPYSLPPSVGPAPFIKSAPYIDGSYYNALLAPASVLKGSGPILPSLAGGYGGYH